MQPLIESILLLAETTGAPAAAESTAPAIGNPLAAIPAYTAIVMLIAGFMIWTSGRRLVKLSAAVCGLVLGALGGAAIGQWVTDGQGALWWMGGFGLAGAAIALLLLRIWVGLSTALVFAVLGPLVWMVWTGVPLPEGFGDRPGDDTEQTDSSPAPSPEGGAADRSDLPRVPGSVDPPTLPRLPDLGGGLPDVGMPRLSDELRSTLGEREARVRQWWNSLSDGQKTSAITICLVGAALGLGMGLLFYKTMGTFQTSLVGSLLLISGYDRLALAIADGSTLPVAEGPRLRMIIIAVLAFLGLAVQMRLWAGRRSR